MKQDTNGIKFYEGPDPFFDYGSRTWQENFETVSRIITEMQEAIKRLEKEVEELKGEHQ